jgi:hypothetical protein
LRKEEKEEMFFGIFLRKERKEANFLGFKRKKKKLGKKEEKIGNHKRNKGRRK